MRWQAGIGFAIDHRIVRPEGDLRHAPAGGGDRAPARRPRHAGWPARCTTSPAHKDAEEQIRRLAHYDPLTGLPNRLLFTEQLQKALAQAERHGRGIAIMFVDLDNFKRVNDTLGHKVGDELLRAGQLAPLPARCVRTTA